MGEKIALSGFEHDATSRFGKRYLRFRAGTKKLARAFINRRLRRRAKADAVRRANDAA